jgi:hypothetical protein
MRFVIRKDVYHDDFFTPGSWPVLANSLKQILQISKLRIYPCFLPHLQHLLTILVENFGFFFALASTDFFAMFVCEARAATNMSVPYQFLNLIF